MDPIPTPNPVLPQTFDASLAAAADNAQSPADRALMSEPYNFQPPPVQPGQQGYDPAQALAQARARDQGQPQPPPAPRQQDQQKQSPPDNQPDNKPDIEFRRKNGRQISREKNWNAINASRDEALARVQELEAQIKAAQNPQQQQQPADPNQPPQNIWELPEVKKLKEERDTFYEEIKHTRVEADPEFKAKFNTKRDAAVRIAKSVSGQAGSDIEKILSITDPDIRAAQLAERLTSGNFSEGSKQRILAANAQLAAIDVEREIEIQTRKATWEHTQASRQQQEQSRMSQKLQNLDSDFNSVLQQWADPEKGMPFVLNNRDGIVSRAKQIFSGEADGKQLAQAALQAAVLPDVIRGWERAVQEVTTLQEQVQRLTGAYPSDAGNSAPYVPPAQNVGPNYDPIRDLSRFSSGLEQARSLDQRGTW